MTINELFLSITLKALMYFTLGMYLLLMHDFVTTLADLCSSYTDLQSVGKPHYTISSETYNDPIRK